MEHTHSILSQAASSLPLLLKRERKRGWHCDRSCNGGNNCLQARMPKLAASFFSQLRFRYVYTTFMLLSPRSCIVALHEYTKHGHKMRRRHNLHSVAFLWKFLSCPWLQLWRRHDLDSIVFPKSSNYPAQWPCHSSSVARVIHEAVKTVCPRLPRLCYCYHNPIFANERAG